MEEKKEIMPIQDMIHEVRGQKVMLDSDLARLYEVEVKKLNQAVKRNIKRFPEDFMFQLTKEEWENLIFQNGISSLRSQIGKILLVLLLAGVLLSGGCRDITPSTYSLSLPELPQHWLSLLGEPSWRIEWVDSNGQKQMMDLIPGGSCAEIEIPITWANPITAWPYWQEHNLIPGFFKPAGAIFPFDADTNKNFLNLTWEAGVDAILYWELANANNEVNSKFPANFNWPKFRELFTSELLSEAVSSDPWLVDWRNFAEKTVSNNFNRRRLVAEKTEAKEIPVPEGTWYGTSPFAQPLFFARETIPVFPIRPGINVWISIEGILRVNGETWIFIEWE